MLDTFLQIAYDKDREDEAERALFTTMSKLPAAELYKLAGGEKLAYGGGLEWLEQYKGTPLFDQAVGLEQKAIQLQMADRQEREQDRVISDQRDQLCMEKKLLDLQLATWQQQQLTGGPAPAAPAPASSPAPEAGSAAPAPAPAAPGGGGTDAAGNPKSVTVKMGSGAGPLTASETLLSLGLGNVPGFLGAKKGKEHSGEALAGGVRGAVGTLLGTPVGAVLGGVGGAAAGRAIGAPGLGALGALGGAIGGGVGGYKLLTRKYDNPETAEPWEARGPAAERAAKEGSARLEQVIGWAHELAHADLAKVAEARQLCEKGVAMGQMMAKSALDPTALLGQAKGLAGKALGAAGTFVKNNPNVAVGAGVGALGGAMAGMQKDDQGHRSLGRAVGGGLLGAATGGLGAHAGSNIAQSVAGGTPIGAAAKHYVNHWGTVLRNAAGSAPGLAPAG